MKQLVSSESCRAAGTAGANGDGEDFEELWSTESRVRVQVPGSGRNDKASQRFLRIEKRGEKPSAVQIHDEAGTDAGSGSRAKSEWTRRQAAISPRKRKGWGEGLARSCRLKCGSNWRYRKHQRRLGDFGASANARLRLVR
jgi:hypothetical protein